MALPILKTGAAAQYPATKSVRYSSYVVCFLDGSGQRYRQYGAAQRQWRFPMALLDQTELSAMEQFFTSQEGQFGGFSFTDPWTATVYPACSIDQDTLGCELSEEMRGATVVSVTENRT